MRSVAYLNDWKMELMAKPRPKTNLTGAQEAYQPRQMMDTENSWARSPGTYIFGRAHVDGADETAAEMETKWGCDRLRLLVEPELREKFDRQRYLFNQAVWHGTIESIKLESGRMVKAWLALDRAATAAGRAVLAPTVWETTTTDGRVIAIVQDDVQAHAAIEAEGRHLEIYTLEEIGRLIEGYPGIAKVKEVFHGATVTSVKRSVDDPLDAIRDTKEPLDDAVGF